MVVVVVSKVHFVIMIIIITLCTITVYMKAVESVGETSKLKIMLGLLAVVY